MKPTRDCEVAPIIEPPALATWEAVDAWMEQMPAGIMFIKDEMRRSYRAGCYSSEPDEYGRRQMRRVFIRIEVDECTLPTEIDARTKPLCDAPILAMNVGPINPRAYHCENCKMIHVR